MITQKNSRGFTLIELIVVILILGILSVVAAPRFISVQDDAHRNIVADTVKKISSAVDLFKIQWIANGHTGAVTDMQNFGNPPYVLDANANGWPHRTVSTGPNLPSSTAPDECAAIFNALVKDGDAGRANALWIATGTGSSCTYAYSGDTTASRSFTLRVDIGEIASVVNP